MSVIYSYTPGSGSSTDQLRLMIPDRVDTLHNPPAMFCDEELKDLLGIYNGDVLETAASACEIVAMDRAKQAINFSINGMSVNKTSIPGFFLQRAKQLRERNDQLSSGEEIDAMIYDVDNFGEDKTEYK